MTDAANGSPALTVVVPAYDEEECLENVVRATLEVLDGLPVEAELIVVDDASGDRTPEVAERLAAEDSRVTTVRHRRNQGSGRAIFSGIEAARGRLVIYVPADGQFHVPEIGAFLEAAGDADVVIGARLERSDYSAFRRLSSAVFVWLLNHLFDQSYRDVNWVHLWRREIFSRFRVRSRGVFFLEETLVRARRAGFTVAELDSRYLPRAAGEAKGARISTILVTIRDMLHLWLELAVGDRLRAAGEAAKSALRFVGRYVVAALLIPVGVAIGVGGLATYWLRKRGRGEEGGE